MTTNNKHLRPELRRETSALWKVPHNRANTKIINEHLSIKSSIVTDFVQPEQNNYPNPRHLRANSSNKNFFFQAKHLFLQVTKAVKIFFFFLLSYTNLTKYTILTLSLEPKVEETTSLKILIYILI